MSFNYKNPITPLISLGNQSVPRTSVYGTNFSILGTGGYMEVYSVNDLYFTIPSGYTGLVEFSANTIPIQFNKGIGSIFSPDVLTLNSDNISSGRRRIGMLVYVIDEDQIYQYQIPNFELLWSGATGATGPGGNTVVFSEFGTTIKSNSPEGIAFISAWTSNTIEGVSGGTSSNSVWKKLVTGGGGVFTGGTVSGATNFTNGLTATTISATTYQNLPTDIRVTGGTKSGSIITFTNNTGGTFTVTGITDTFVTGGTYDSGTSIITFTNNTGGTFTVTGITAGGGGTGPISVSGTSLYSNNPATSNFSTSDSIFFGANAGSGATNAAYSNFFGQSAGYQASNANDSNFFGRYAGYLATDARYSNFLGYQAGQEATSAGNSNFLGISAGYLATNANESNFFGTQAGQEATNANGSNFLGTSAGYQATNANFSNFFGTQAGFLATDANESNFFGTQAGQEATNANGSNFIGTIAGYQATNANFSNFLGYQAGYLATNANESNFFGTQAGFKATSASFSNLFGFNVGRTFSGNNLSSNNIIIGTNISLPNGTANAINIGGVLFGINTYSTTGGTSSITPQASGRIGIGVVTPQETLHVSGNTLINGTLTATTALFSSSTQNVLNVVGSGSTSPIFRVQGSQGELFAVTDSLTGSLFSVNDISGLPIMEVFSDNTILMGSYFAPSLNTTYRLIVNSGSTNLYSIPVSAYTGAFYDYTVSDASNARAGNIMAIFSGTSVQYTETSTLDIGSTTGVTFSVAISSGNAVLRVSATTNNWSVKTIIRSI